MRPRPRIPKQRREYRQLLVPQDPVRLLIDGTEAEFKVDELSIGGARLIIARHFDCLEVGEVFGPTTLVLEDADEEQGQEANEINVTFVVKWKRWPHLGIEFRNLSPRNREAIYRFLFKVQRHLIRSPQTKRNPHWSQF